MKRLLRLKYLLQNLKNYDADLNRRAAVETEMWACAAGKQPMPDAQKLREWALKLGVPDEFRERLALASDRNKDSAPTSRS